MRVMTRLQNPGPDKPLPTALETPQPWHALAIEVCGNAFSGKSALCQARPVEPMAWPLNLCTDEGLGAKRSISGRSESTNEMYCEHREYCE